MSFSASADGSGGGTSPQSDLASLLSPTSSGLAGSSGSDFVSDLTQGVKSGEMAISMDELERLANRDLVTAIDILQARLTMTGQDRVMIRRTGGQLSAYGSGPSFSEVSWSGDLFGPTPEGEQLSAQVRAAHEVYKQTISGAIDDLQRFRQNLIASVAHAKESDESAREALLRAASLGELKMDHAEQRAVERYDAVLAPEVADQPVPATSVPDAESYAESVTDSSPGPSSVGEVADGSTGSAAASAPVTETFERPVSGR